jgi:hypothetical protein
MSNNQRIEPSSIQRIEPNSIQRIRNQNNVNQLQINKNKVITNISSQINNMNIKDVIEILQTNENLKIENNVNKNNVNKNNAHNILKQQVRKLFQGMNEEEFYKAMKARNNSLAENDNQNGGAKKSKRKSPAKKPKSKKSPAKKPKRKSPTKK